MSFIFYSSENDITFTAMAKILNIKIKDFKKILQYKGYFKRSKLEPFDFYIKSGQQENYFAYRHYNGISHSSIVITEEGQKLITTNWNTWLKEYETHLKEHVTEPIELNEVVIKINRNRTNKINTNIFIKELIDMTNI